MYLDCYEPEYQLLTLFILQYYEGSPLNEVAWGKIKTNEQIEQLNRDNPLRHVVLEMKNCPINE